MNTVNERAQGAVLGLAVGDAVIDAAIAESMITHADPRCVLACAAFDAAIAAAVVADPTATAMAAPLDGAAMLAVARRALGVATAQLAERWRELADGGFDPRTVTAAGLAIGREDLAAIDSAQDDLARDLDAATADDPGLYTPELHVHHTGGFVRVAFRLAFWHCAHTPSWRAALVDTASRGGDADTNAAIVGALLGARDGASAIPEAWRIRVLSARQKGSAAWGDEHHPRHLLALAE